MKLNGTVTVNSGCGVYVDSNSTSSPYAMTVSGGATVSASKTQIVGDWNSNGGGTVTPAPTTGVTATTDPLIGMQPPTYGGCDHSAGLENASSSVITSTMAANGGVFVECGGFSMNGSPTISLPSGTYVMKGGIIDWRNGNLSGTGVTFYITGGLSTININGNVVTNLSAPTSGPLHGMLFFEDRSTTQESMNITINGGSNLVLDGSIYFPNQDISYSGGSTTTNNYTVLVAYRITFVGNSYFKADLGGMYTGLAAPAVGILE
jgi:hypothetical protein